MVDLHIHSTYSDGSYTVKEILQEAQNKNLEVISIFMVILYLIISFIQIIVLSFYIEEEKHVIY